VQRDYCFTGIASTTANPAICEEVVEDYQKRNCVSRIYERIIRDIIESKSEQHALDFCKTDVEDSLQRDICFTEIAHMSTDSSICEMVIDDDLKRSCERYIGLNKERSN
jgi:hypothetical protein